MDFSVIRKNLYYLSVAIHLVVMCLLLVVLLLVDAVEPIWQGPVDIARVFMPGLLENLVAAGLRFPLLGIILTPFILIMSWFRQRMKTEEQEWAFQGWRSGQGKSFQPNPPIQCVERIAKISRFFSILYVPVFVLSVLLVLSLLIYPLLHLACTVFAHSEPENKILHQSACCADVSGLRRLGVGETVQVHILANRKRNETGLLLLEGDKYKARYIQREKWMDGKYNAGPNGVKFEGFVGFLAKLFEWLRPYPAGNWFQIIGRIDRRHDVFPVLDATDPEKPNEFEATSDGELVLFVNDLWYPNNSGAMTISIHRPWKAHQCRTRYIILLKVWRTCI